MVATVHNGTTYFVGKDGVSVYSNSQNQRVVATTVFDEATWEEKSWYEEKQPPHPEPRNRSERRAQQFNRHVVGPLNKRKIHHHG